jgi:hypothetical protein
MRPHCLASLPALPSLLLPPAAALPCLLLPAELQAFDSAAEWRGPLFRLPITVIKPLDPEGQPGSSSGNGAVVRSDCSVDLGEWSFAAVDAAETAHSEC